MIAKLINKLTYYAYINKKARSPITESDNRGLPNAQGATYKVPTGTITWFL